MSEIINLAEFSTIQPKGVRVLVGGCFDILHIGHVEFLKAAKKQGDTLIIVLESDEFIRQRKHKEPFHSQLERAQILAAVRYVDIVVLLPLVNGFDGYLNITKNIQPQVIAVTQNDPHLNEKQKMAEIVGAKVTEVVKPVSEKSSSLLREYVNTHKDVQ